MNPIEGKFVVYRTFVFYIYIMVVLLALSTAWDTTRRGNVSWRMTVLSSDRVTLCVCAKLELLRDT